MKNSLVLVFTLIVTGILFPSANAQEEFDEEFVEYIIDHLDNIRGLLDETKTEYASGNQEEALRLATIAYLEHYEYIEFELGQYNEELIEEVEWAMREELRGMIQENAPVSDVEEKIDEILVKLDEIALIVPEFGVVAILILAISIFSVILLQKKKFPNYQF